MTGLSSLNLTRRADMRLAEKIFYFLQLQKGFDRSEAIDINALE